MGSVARSSIFWSASRRIAPGALVLLISGCAPKFNFSPSLNVSEGCSPSGSYKLAFSTQPTSSISAGEVLPTGGVIEAQDNCGNLITTGALSSATVLLSDESGNGNIAGVSSVTLSGGIATIPNNTLRFERSGTTSLGATTTAAGYGTVSGTSASISIAQPSFSTVSAFSGPDDPNADVDGDGTTTARLNYPGGLIGTGGYIYIAESYPSCVIRRYNTASPYDVATWTGILYNCGYTDGATGTATIGGSQYTAGPWNELATDGNYVYFADGCSIRAAEIGGAGDGTIATIAGNPTSCGYSDANGTSAQFRSIGGLYVSGSTLYVADNSYIRAVSLVSPYAVTTVAGNGTGAIQDSSPGPGEVDRTGYLTGDSSNLYFIDYDGTHTDIRQMAFTGNTLTTDYTDIGSSLCGGDAEGNVFGDSITVSGTSLYLECIGQIESATIGTWTFSTVAGVGWHSGEADGGSAASLMGNGVFLWGSGTNVYFSDDNNGTLRVLDNTNTVTTLAGTPNAGDGWTMNASAANSRYTNLIDLVSDGTNLYSMSEFDGLAPVSMTNGATGSTIHPAGFGSNDYYGQPMTVMGGKIYFANYCEVDLLDPVAGTLSPVAGTGTCGENEGSFSTAEFVGIQAMVSDQNNLYVFDNDAIKKLNMSTTTVSVLSGTPGSSGCANGPAAASLYSSTGEMAYLNGDIYFSQWECGNNQIFQVNTATGASAVYAGNGSFGASNGALLSSSFGGQVGEGLIDLNITTDGVNLYVLDTTNGLVREINVAAGTVSTLYGSTGQIWQLDGSLASARENAGGVAAWTNGSIYYGWGKLYIGDERGIRLVQ